MIAGGYPDAFVERLRARRLDVDFEKIRLIAYEHRAQEWNPATVDSQHGEIIWIYPGGRGVNPISVRKRWPPVGSCFRRSTRVITSRSLARVIPT